MNRTTWLLLALLGLTNAMWWLGMPRAHAAGALFEPDSVESSILRKQLDAALARITRLEARTANPAPSGTRTQAAPSLQATSNDTKTEAVPDPRDQQVGALASAWCAEALQNEDAVRRQAALAGIRDGLLSDDPVEVEAALRALVSVRELELDSATFRSLVLPLLEAQDDRVRSQAVRILGTFLHDEEDLPLVLERLDDSSSDARWWAARLLGRFEGSAVTSASLRLLDDPDPRVRNAVLRRVTPEEMEGPLGRRLLELCADPDVRDEVVTTCFTRLREKSPAVIELMIETVRDTGSAAHMVTWELTSGVPEHSHARVASAFLDELAVRTSDHGRIQALKLVAKYGDPSHLSELERLAANPLASESLRQAARRAIDERRAEAGD